MRKREVEIVDIELPNLDHALIKGTFSDEKYKSIRHNVTKELNDVREGIQTLESDMQGVIWARDEINNLEAASIDLKQKINDLGIEQKKILCDLFVERVEINRTETPKGKRKIRANVFFRFNPSQLMSPMVGVRTKQSLTIKDTSDVSQGINDGGGERRRSGYIPIKVSASFNKAEGLNRHNQAGTDYIESKWLEPKGLYRAKFRNYHY